MKSQIRHLITEALWHTKSYSLPAVCERYGHAPADGDEAFSSKRQYVLKRLEKLSDEKVLQVAQLVLADVSDDPLQAAVEQLIQHKQLVSDVTRQRMAEALNRFSLSGKIDLLEFLRMHWPDIGRMSSNIGFEWTVADELYEHAVKNDDYTNEEILKLVGFFNCSQSKVFGFIEAMVHPLHRDEDEQIAIVEKLDPLLRRDGFTLAKSGRVSGYPVYHIQPTAPAGSHPADELISETIASFDEAGVHDAWQKALDRRSSDPEGAITAAKTLLETVCKHIIEEGDGPPQYGSNDDLPKLYHLAAEQLNLAPSQHTEAAFKSILGNCQAVVGQLSGVRNKLGDSHGQGKRFVRPKARHAELAVNLAGSMAMFLISAWVERKGG
jgi:AbiJ N-terminal domain 3/Abortive infection C-terminus